MFAVQPARDRADQREVDASVEKSLFPRTRCQMRAMTKWIVWTAMFMFVPGDSKYFDLAE